MSTSREWRTAQRAHHDGVADGEYDESVLREYAYFDGVIRRYLRGLRRDGTRRVLDFGCGTGRVTHPATRTGLSVVAMDISLGMVTRTQAKVTPSLRSRARFVVADGTRLPFRDGSFDAVVCAGVLHHIEDVDAGIREQVRVLRARGRLFIGEPCADFSRIAWLLNRTADRLFCLANSAMHRMGLGPRFLAAKRSPGERPLTGASIAATAEAAGMPCTCRWFMHHALVNRYLPFSTLFYRVLNAVWRGKGGDIVIVTGRRD